MTIQKVLNLILCFLTKTTWVFLHVKTNKNNNNKGKHHLSRDSWLVTTWSAILDWGVATAVFNPYSHMRGRQDLRVPESCLSFLDRCPSVPPWHRHTSLFLSHSLTTSSPLSVGQRTLWGNLPPIPCEQPSTPWKPRAASLSNSKRSSGQYFFFNHSFQNPLKL